MFFPLEETTWELWVTFATNLHRQTFHLFTSNVGPNRHLVFLPYVQRQWNTECQILRTQGSYFHLALLMSFQRASGWPSVETDGWSQRTFGLIQHKQFSFFPFHSLCIMGRGRNSILLHFLRSTKRLMPPWCNTHAHPSRLFPVSHHTYLVFMASKWLYLHPLSEELWLQ